MSLTRVLKQLILKNSNKLKSRQVEVEQILS